VKGTLINAPEIAYLNSVRMYSHSATGRMRLAIYDNDPTTRTLLWQSGPIANTAQNDWIVAQISDGAPPSLRLDPGSYWLAWQVDTTVNAPSYSNGSANSGFWIPRSFDYFCPAMTVAQSTITAENWSVCLDYTAATATPSLTPTPSLTETPSLTPSLTPTETPTPTASDTLTPSPSASETPTSSPTATDALTPTPTPTEKPNGWIIQ